MLQLTEMPESDKVDLSPAKGKNIYYKFLNYFSVSFRSHRTL